MRCAISLALLLIAASPAVACEPPPSQDGPAGWRRIEGARHVVAFRTAPAPTPLNAPFVVDFRVCAKDGAVEAPPKVDAWMPAHRHGMNYRPSVTPVAAGSYRAEGLLLHMPGRWEFVFEIGGERLTATQDLK
jgi:hypothetical protein